MASNNAALFNDLKNNSKLDPSTTAYVNIVKLIKSLRIEKSIKQDRTFYTLAANYDENTADYNNFQDRLKTQI